MTSFNRGEWSEVYGVLFLLIKPKMQLVDSELNPIPNSDFYTIRKIILESTIKLEYEILDDSIAIFIQETEFNRLSKEEIDYNRKLLLKKIQCASKKSGAFEIPSIESFLSKLSNGHVIKGKSKDKSDIKLIAFDRVVNDTKTLTYSIKSSLGSPATILNASTQTNFLFEVKNLNPLSIDSINSINTNTKLLDRIKAIEANGGVIKFKKVCSDTLDYNLKMIDSKLPEYLGNALLYSYTKNTKDLKEIFLSSNTFIDMSFGLKKLGDFLSGISFGFIPGEKWNGKKTVTGGLLVVKSNGDIVFLDLIYYESEVRDYMINESKLDSPSSKRYKMLELTNDNGTITFSLNLQVRYKK